MNIPNSIRIAGIEHPVKYVENLNDGYRVLKGQFESNKHIISLNPTEDNDEHDKAITFLHEVLHAIRDASGIEIKDEEKVVELFAKGLYQVIQDNESRLFDVNK